MSAEGKLCVLPARWRMRITSDRVVAGQAVQEAHIERYEMSVGRNPVLSPIGNTIITGLGGNSTIENTSDLDQLLRVSFFYKHADGGLRVSHSATNLYQDNSKEKFDAQDLGNGISFWLLLEKI